MPPPLVAAVEGTPPGPPPGPPPPPERELWPWLLALLVVVLVGLGVGLWLSQRGGEKKKASTTAAASTVFVTQTAPTRTKTAPTSTTAPTATVNVPGVIGLARDAAVRQLRTFGFRTALRTQASSRPPGTVVGQNPAAGARVARGATVILAISQKASPPATTVAATRAKPPPAAKVAVPDLLGMSSNEAAQRLRAAGLEPGLRTVRSSKPAGIVVAQSPGAGRELARGGRVILDVSSGAPATTAAGTTTTTAAPQTTSVPDLVGQQRADAQSALREVGLVAEVKGVPSAEPEGTVVSQAPKAGTSLKRGEHVLINVASGQKPGEGAGPPTTVPDVVGLQRDEAQLTLRRAGFVTEVKTYPSTKSEGTVLAQQPKAGATVKRGAHVLINVSNGQPP